MSSPWKDDRLGYQEIGETYTNLLKSIDSGKVLSIEASFGRGKTFFRRAWGEHLRQQGEAVVEIDVQQSDHSGDPIVTLLGALVACLPSNKRSAGRKALDVGKKFGAIGARTVAHAVLRSGADELIGAITNKAADALGDFGRLEKAVADLGTEMSKVAGQMIASQMAAEKVRTEELPGQLSALKEALLEGKKGSNVVILVDELDRCHPDYAISFLESMKLVFSQSGFIFFLMTHERYLENLARHKFGELSEDERYLDKFVDIRLRLEAKGDVFASAVYDIAMQLPMKIPYGGNKAFSIESSAELATNLAVHTNYSLRKVKRILLKVELALRCYADRPLDLPLLIFLAFRDESDGKIEERFLPRSFLTPEAGESLSSSILGENQAGIRERGRIENDLNSLIKEKASELLGPAHKHYRTNNGRYHDWYLIFKILAPEYIPSHQSILNGVAPLIVKDTMEET